MTFKKLVLVSAMFAATSGAFAMEAMDEEALAAATGQDGITIGINTQASLDVVIHDKGGFTGATSDGAIFLSGVGLSDGNATPGDAQLEIKIDAGHDGVATTAGAALNINIANKNAIVVDLGVLSVSESTGYVAGTTVAGTTLLDMGTLSLASGTLANIQLGHEYQGNLISIKTSLASGLTINGFSLNDVSGAATGGSIYVNELKVTDAAGAGLNVDLGIDAVANGLAVTVKNNGLGTGGMRVTMKDVRLGNNTQAAIGDVEIRNLNLSGDVITIRGH